MSSFKATDLGLMLGMYRQMLGIRRAEEKLIELWNSEEIQSLMHLSTGQEAVAVGVCSALAERDLAFSTHRCHAHYLAKGGSLKKMYAELAGKIGGCAQGRGGSMHLFDLDAGVFLSVPLVGGSISIGVGTALSAKIKGLARVTVVFFGDGAVEEGVFWESLNFASVFKLPVLFVCENNLYATHSHILKRQPGIEIAKRIEPWMPAVTIDGNNVSAIFAEAESMVSRIRNGHGPFFMEAMTYRWKEHWGPGEDWHLGYRSQEEGNYWKEKCPIKHLRQYLSASGYAVDFAAIDREITAQIKEAVEFAKNSPKPEGEELFQW